jgi:nitrous oxidase accessory protein NosD
MKKLNAFLVLAMTVFFFYSTAMGATLIVNHNDEDAQFQTIKDAIEKAQTGDIIKVRATDKDNPYKESVKIDKNLTIVGDGPQYTFIESEGSVFSFEGDYRTVTIIGFHIKSKTSNGIIINEPNTTLSVHNCIIVDCQNGIYLYNQTGCKITIQNNIILNCKNNGIYYSLSNSSSVYGYLKVEGNIIYNNANYGVTSKYVSTEIAKYNNVYDNKQGAFESLSVNTNDKNIIDSEPGFLNEIYVLRKDPKSPCIDNGIVGNDYYDPDGTPNDIGAYGGPYSAPFWPYETPGGGPIITNLDITPSSFPKGHKIIIRAKGRVQ